MNNNLNNVSSKYPYEEGDDYYVLERLGNNKVNIIWSCWNDQSKVIYDELRSKQEFPPLYFDSLITVRKYCKAVGLQVNQIYDYEKSNYNFNLKTTSKC